MPTIGTPPLTPAQTWAEVDALAAWCAAQGSTQLVARYGWGCRADPLPQQMACADLAAWLGAAMAADRYTLGEDNLHLCAVDGAWELLLCHEGDVHFSSADAAWVAEWRRAWTARGYAVWGDDRTSRKTSSVGKS